MLTTILASVGLAAPVQSPATSHRIDFRASTFVLSSQSDADLAIAPDGSVIAAWSSRRQNGGKYGVFAQRFDPDGRAVGEEFSLSAWRENHQSVPSVASTRLGTTWAVWQSHGQDGDAGGVVARFFDAQGNASEEILVNQTTEGHQANPVIAAIETGGVVIAWEDQRSKGAQTVRYRVFDASGHAVGDERRVAADGTRQATASVAGSASGFAVAWSEFDPDSGVPMGVRVRTFDDAGTPLHDAVAPASQHGSQVEPVLKATSDGYVLAWIDTVDASMTNSYEVLAARLGAGGRSLGEPIVVSTRREGVQNAPAIAVRRDGAIAIAFNSDEGESRGVFARLFDRELSPLGDEFRLTNASEGDQLLREAAGTSRLAFSAGGELLCAWSGDAGLGDGSSANVTLASASPIVELARGVHEGMCAAPFGTMTDLAAGPHVPPTFNPLDVARDEQDVRITPEGLGFLAITDTGWTPPDPHMAVGPDHVVVMTNGEIAFFTKDGTNTFRDEIEDSFGFWGSLGTTNFVFDPEVLYDAAEGRFIAMAAEAFDGPRSHVLLAISDDSDPNGTWHKYRFETTSLAGDLFDSPNIAVTADAVIVTGDGFGIGANYPIFTWDKASLYAGDPPAISRRRTLATSTQSAGIPPVSLPDPGVLYMVEHQEGNGRTGLRLIALSDALGSPSVTTTDLTADSYGAPADPSQMGTGVRPNTFDARFWSTAYAGGSLWATHHVSSPVVRVRWYEIDMRGWPLSGDTPALVQSGEIQPDASTHTFFSAITANADGLAAVTYAQSSPSEFISMRTAYRLPGDPLGTMRLGDAQQANTGPYIVTRWGDYSACEIDPADNATIWSHHEYAQGNSWRTWVAAIETETGCAGDLDGDGDVDADDFFRYLDLFAGGDPEADLDGDGDRDADDFFAYLDLFSRGC